MNYLNGMSTEPTVTKARFGRVQKQATNFWRTQTIVKLVHGSLAPGTYQVELQLSTPALAELQLVFDSDERPPLVLELPSDRTGHCRKTFRISAPVYAAKLLLEPGVDPGTILSLQIERIGFGRLLRLGARRAVKNVTSPIMLVRKIRQFFMRSNTVALSPDAGAKLNAKDAYQVWQEIFEGPNERKRLLSELQAHASQGIPTMLAVFVSSAGGRETLKGFLSYLERRECGCRLVPLIIEGPEAPLPPDLRAMAVRKGVKVHQLECTTLPLRVINAYAQAEDATGFVFIERQGQFQDLAFASFLIEFNRAKDCLAAYGDSNDGDRRAPSFKPKWSPEYALSFNYVGPAIAFRAAPELLTSEIELQHLEAPSFEFLLHVSSHGGPGSIRHIPRILFHQASSEMSPKRVERRQMAEFEAARAWLAEQRPNASIAVQPPKSEWTLRKVAYALPSPAPLVSVIVPTKDNPGMLKDAVASVLESSCSRKELIIVDNGSHTKVQQSLLQEIGSSQDVTVISDPSPFNFSSIINTGRQAANGDVLLLLNDDVKAISDDWMEELTSLACQPDIGCVGALLLYPNGTVQHGGIIMGLHGVAGHAFRGEDGDAPGAGWRLKVRHEVSAVTGACLAVRTAVFDEIGGFDETLPVAMNDVDFCLQARARGYRNILTPHAKLIHYESVSRGHDTTPERVERLSHETAKFMRKWSLDVLDDPYYSPHLSKRQNYKLRLET